MIESIGINIENIWVEFAGVLQLMLKGLLIGIIASAPMGPTGVLVIQRTMYKSRRYGFATGVGAAISDMSYALVTLVGMNFVTFLIEDPQTVFWLKLLGSVLLLCFGIWMFFTDPRKSIRRKRDVEKDSLRSNLLTGFLLTVSNPLIILLFIALYNLLTFAVPNFWLDQLVGYSSIFFGALLWWFGLTHVISKMKQNFGLHGMLYINRTVGSIVIAGVLIYATNTIFRLSLF